MLINPWLLIINSLKFIGVENKIVDYVGRNEIKNISNSTHHTHEAAAQEVSLVQQGIYQIRLYYS